MKVSDLIAELYDIQQTHGNIDVMIDPHDGPIGPWSADAATFREVEDEDDYPEDYGMPAGFKYIEIARWG